MFRRTKTTLITKPIEFNHRCCRQLHKVFLHPNGQLSFPNHKGDNSLRNEELVSALSGEQCKCAIVLENWRKGRDEKLPEQLRKACRGRGLIRRISQRLMERGTFSDIPKYIDIPESVWKTPWIRVAYLAKQIAKELSKRGLHSKIELHHKTTYGHIRVHHRQSNSYITVCEHKTSYSSADPSGISVSSCEVDVNYNTPRIPLRQLVLMLYVSKYRQELENRGIKETKESSQFITGVNLDTELNKLISAHYNTYSGITLTMSLKTKDLPTAKALYRKLAALAKNLKRAIPTLID